MKKSPAPKHGRTRRLRPHLAWAEAKLPAISPPRFLLCKRRRRLWREHARLMSTPTLLENPAVANRLLLLVEILALQEEFALRSRRLPMPRTPEEARRIMLAPTGRWLNHRQAKSELRDCLSAALRSWRTGQ
jgi:hypothetical protein